MPYELSLEYGTYPIKTSHAFLEERQTPPEFLVSNQALLEKIDKMNELFHELFLTIECSVHYIGNDYPEKIQLIRKLYDEVAKGIETSYPEQKIKIEHFIL
jgi:hypothetical protein